jgi:hypothetical protein
MGAAVGTTVETKGKRMKDRMLIYIIYYGSLVIPKMCRFH